MPAERLTPSFSPASNNLNMSNIDLLTVQNVCPTIKIAEVAFYSPGCTLRPICKSFWTHEIDNWSH